MLSGRGALLKTLFEILPTVAVQERKRKERKGEVEGTAKSLNINCK
jgi:hypothetical protein